MDNRGNLAGSIQLMIGAFMTVFIGILLLAIFFPMTNTVLGQAVASNMSNFSMESTIIMVLQMAGVLLVVGFIIAVVNSYQGSSTPPQSGY